MSHYQPLPGEDTRFVQAMNANQVRPGDDD
jgi:hypothetical protein